MMGKSKLAGALWLLAALFAVVIAVIFRVDPVQWVITIAAAVAAAVVGFLLLSRPNASLFAWSNAAGVIWLLLYAALMVVQWAEPAASGTDAFLGLLGVAAALLAYRAGKLAGNRAVTRERAVR